MEPTTKPLTEVPTSTTGAAISLRTATMAVADGQEGVHEEGGDNHGKMVNEYQRAGGAADGQPWCACFCNWCAEQGAKQCGCKSPLEDVANQALVQSYVDHFKKLGKTYTDPKQIRPGDMFAIWFPNLGRYGHIGFVRSPNLAQGTFLTREGNSNDEGSREGYEVCSNARRITDRILFIRWTD